MTPTQTPSWVRELRQAHLTGELHEVDCLGSLANITPAARRRGAQEVREGVFSGLGRVIDPPGEEFELLVSNGSLEDWTVGTDRQTIEPHGMRYTHLDGITHIGIDGQWHSGDDVTVPVDRFSGWAKHGISTRAIVLDVASFRESAWVSGDPVDARELDEMVELAGVTIEPGDGLVLYMGRDAYEASGGVYDVISRSPDGRPGLGESGARWIAEKKIGILAWDFLDAHGPGLPLLATHALIWAIGLAIVDNCDLADAVAKLKAAGRSTAQLVVAPLPIVGATGCAVNPSLQF